MFKVFSLGRVLMYAVVMYFSLPKDPGQDSGHKSGQQTDSTNYDVHFKFPHRGYSDNGAFTLGCPEVILCFLKLS